MSYKVKPTIQRSLVGQQNKIRETFFFKTHAKNETGKLLFLTDHSLLLKKALYEVKASDLQLSFNTL